MIALKYSFLINRINQLHFCISISLRTEDTDMKKISLVISNTVNKCWNDTTVLKAYPNAWFYDSQKKPLVND